MRKVCKIILIILFYVFMFWGLISGVKAVLHKTKKCSNCDKSEIVEVFAEEVKEIPIEESKEETKEESKEETKEESKEEPPIIEKKTEEPVKTTVGSVADYQSYAHDLVINSYLWSEEDFQALVNLWNRESGWNANAHNNSSGAHGIPQSLPASKMASEGDDYYTNGYTQIRWGLKYIRDRYGSPSAAWQHFQNKNWY